MPDWNTNLERDLWNRMRKTEDQRDAGHRKLATLVGVCEKVLAIPGWADCHYELRRLVQERLRAGLRAVEEGSPVPVTLCPPNLESAYCPHCEEELRCSCGWPEGD